MSVRLVTFNIRHGLMPDDRVDVPFLGATLARFDADVVVLQEVDRGQVRSGGVDTALEVAAAIGAHDHRFLPAVAGTMEPRRADDGGVLGGDDDPALILEAVTRARGRARVREAWRALRSRAGRRALNAYLRTWLSRRPASPGDPDHTPGYGIAVIARVPVREWRRIRLPIESRWLFGRLQVRHDEPRVAILAVLETRDGPLTVVGTHLSSGTQWNRTQLRWLVEELRDVPRPLVLLGDLNIRGSEPAEITGWPDLVAEPTYPRQRPRLQLDHVLVADGDPAVAAEAVQVLDLGVSDHRAVVVDVRLNAG